MLRSAQHWLVDEDIARCHERLGMYYRGSGTRKASNEELNLADKCRATVKDLWRFDVPLNARLSDNLDYEINDDRITVLSPMLDLKIPAAFQEFNDAVYSLTRSPSEAPEYMAQQKLIPFVSNLMETLYWLSKIGRDNNERLYLYGTGWRPDEPSNNERSAITGGTAAPEDEAFDMDPEQCGCFTDPYILNGLSSIIGAASVMTRVQEQYKREIMSVALQDYAMMLLNKGFWLDDKPGSHVSYREVLMAGGALESEAESAQARAEDIARYVVHSYAAGKSARSVLKDFLGVYPVEWPYLSENGDPVRPIIDRRF